MFGAITGDIIGSPYEFAPNKNMVFPLFCTHSVFTDDTILTIMIADVLLHDLDIINTLKEYSRKYPDGIYDRSYKHWALSDSREPYNTWGNCSAMRTNPIGFFCYKESDVSEAAKMCAQVTHNHPESISGAQSTTLRIFLARQGASKSEF